MSWDRRTTPARPVYEAPLCAYCREELDLVSKHLHCPACGWTFCLDVPVDTGACNEGHALAALAGSW